MYRFAFADAAICVAAAAMAFLDEFEIEGS